MDDPVGRGANDLYESDFYAWTQRQATLIRDGDVAAADLPNILEEIETLGRGLASELRSRLRILTAHILKELYQPEKSTRSWATTILSQRIEIADHLEDNPSLVSKLDPVFARAYADGRKLASSETGLPPEELSCRAALQLRRRPLASVEPAQGRDRPEDIGRAADRRPSRTPTSC